MDPFAHRLDYTPKLQAAESIGERTGARLRPVASVHPIARLSGGVSGRHGEKPGGLEPPPPPPEPPQLLAAFARRAAVAPAAAGGPLATTLQLKSCPVNLKSSDRWGESARLLRGEQAAGEGQRVTREVGSERLVVCCARSPRGQLGQ